MLNFQPSSVPFWRFYPLAFNTTPSNAARQLHLWPSISIELWLPACILWYLAVPHLGHSEMSLSSPGITFSHNCNSYWASQLHKHSHSWSTEFLMVFSHHRSYHSVTQSHQFLLYPEILLRCRKWLLPQYSFTINPFIL